MEENYAKSINSFDVIIALLRGCKEDPIDHSIEGPLNHNVRLGSCKYLLGQTVRQLWNLPGHRCVSKGAMELWNRLKIEKSIFDCHYKMKVEFKNEEPIKLGFYVGAKSKPSWEEEVFVGSTRKFFYFREVFHIEHTVPINMILDELYKIDLNQTQEELYSCIHNVLKRSLYACWMRKEEDRRLNHYGKNKRSLDAMEVINNNYAKAGIEIAKWVDASI